MSIPGSTDDLGDPRSKVVSAGEQIPVALSGLILGYDPGGNAGHGLAKLLVEGDEVANIETCTLETVEETIAYVEELRYIVAFGVDTLTCWSTGHAAWRPADRWLRERYPEKWRSIISPNRLQGAMCLNGMAVLLATRDSMPEAVVTEAHPKVLLWHMGAITYRDLERNHEIRATALPGLHLDALPASVHEWDAALSAIAAYSGYARKWNRDLHSLPTCSGERLIHPCGETHFWWPV